jgi:hypothetical protein
MYEYVTVSASPYDAPGLAAKLTERSAEGWEVVAIVPTGSDVTAFCRRPIGASEPVEAPTVTTDEPAPVSEAVPVEDLAPVAEPAGWAVAPEPAAEPTPEPAVAPAEVAAAPEPERQPEPQPEPQPAPAPVAPTVPAGWYADPAGRYELRYWDGSQWTEHVARGGAQYTDPPVA